MSVTPPLAPRADPAPTWRSLVALEPRLADLADLAHAIQDDGRADRFCANQHWYSRLRPRLVGLVGWDARGRDPALRSEAAYDVALAHLYGLLPDCRHDGGCWR